MPKANRQFGNNNQKWRKSPSTPGEILPNNLEESGQNLRELIRVDVLEIGIQERLDWPNSLERQKKFLTHET